MKATGKIVCYSPKNFHYIATSPSRKHWAAIGQIGAPIGVTVHSLYVESFENILQRYIGEGWVAMDKEKQFFWTPCILYVLPINQYHPVYICQLLYLLDNVATGCIRGGSSKGSTLTKIKVQRSVKAF